MSTDSRRCSPRPFAVGTGFKSFAIGSRSSSPPISVNTGSSRAASVADSAERRNSSSNYRSRYDRRWNEPQNVVQLMHHQKGQGTPKALHARKGKTQEAYSHRARQMEDKRRLPFSQCTFPRNSPRRKDHRQVRRRHQDSAVTYEGRRQPQQYAQESLAEKIHPASYRGRKHGKHRNARNSQQPSNRSAF